MVVGILVAFQVESYKEDLQKNEMAESYLRQIQVDLLDDIEEANTLSQIVMDKKLFVTAYLSDDINSQYYSLTAPSAMFATYSYNINDIGYQNFTSHLDQIPEKYLAIADQLNLTYTKYDVKTAQEIVIKISNEANAYVNDRVPDLYSNGNKYFYDDPPGPHNKKLIHFYQSDSTIKNKLEIFWDWNYRGLYKYIRKYQQTCITTYQEIGRLLGDTSLPATINEFILTGDHSHQEGHYVDVDNPSSQFDIVQVGNYLCVVYDDTQGLLSGSNVLYRANDSTMLYSPHNLRFGVSEVTFSAQYDTLFEKDIIYNDLWTYVKSKH